MSIELPDEMVWAMGMLGLPWPNIDEDRLRDYAGHLRTFAHDMKTTFTDAHVILKGLGDVWKGQSYTAVADRWAQASHDHVDELTSVCDDVASGLDAAADGVVVAKTAILGALAAFVAEFAVDQAAAIASFGLAEAAIPALVAATRAIVKSLLDTLEQTLIADGLQMVLSPLEDRVASAVQGLVIQGVDMALAS